ncbi:MAG: YraN family protein [Alphaproteobacteria bacterium]
MSRFAAPHRRRDRGLAAWRRGHGAETFAALFLMLKGYRILARRLVTPRGEIDLVARRGRLIVFVEVKARPTLEQALGALTPSVCRRLSRAAYAAVAQHAHWGDAAKRLDAIAIVPGRWPVHRRNLIVDDPWGRV